MAKGADRVYLTLKGAIVNRPQLRKYGLITVELVGIMRPVPNQNN